MKSAFELFGELPEEWRKEAQYVCSDVELERHYLSVEHAIVDLLINRNIQGWDERLIVYKAVTAYIEYANPGEDSGKIFKEFKDQTT